MASFDSKDGVWIPKTEKVALVERESGEPFIYEGPDRAALDYLKKEGVDHLGVHFTKDADIIFRAKQLNMTLEEFCELHKNTEAERKKTFDAAHATKVLHRPTPRKEGVKDLGGGKDFANQKNNMSGALGELPSTVPSNIGQHALNK